MNEIGKNLKRIRLLNNMSLKKAGDLLNMSATAIAKYENGIIIPNSKKLIEFSKAYNVKVKDILKVHNAPQMKFDSFRKKQRLKGQKLELLKELIQNKVSDYLEVIDLCGNINQFKLKRYLVNNYNDIELSAEEFRKDYDLSINQPISNLINILENIGILIIQIDNKDNIFSDFDGLSEIVNDIPVIVLLKDNDGARQRFTIAHELGHLILDINNKLDKEKVCNKFAGALLMPAGAIVREFGLNRKNISLYELKVFKIEYKVSMSAIIYRLRELNVINEYLYKKINITFNKNGIKRNEPININPEESYQYKKLVHRLEIDNIITINKACSLLDITTNEYNVGNYNN